VQNDFPVTQAIVLTISLFYIVLTLAADLLNAWLDPRLRVAGAV
jgi:peptide/nickel transport system permease protein